MTSWDDVLDMHDRILEKPDKIKRTTRVNLWLWGFGGGLALPLPAAADPNNCFGGEESSLRYDRNARSDQSGMGQKWFQCRSGRILPTIGETNRRSRCTQIRVQHRRSDHGQNPAFGQGNAVTGQCCLAASRPAAIPANRPSEWTVNPTGLWAV